MKRTLKHIITVIMTLVINVTCTSSKKNSIIQDVKGANEPTSDDIWLSHEHILVDFIGADSIRPDLWNHDSIMGEVMPYFEGLEEFNVSYFVDATPNYVGRNVLLLEKIADRTGLKILTNTGLYGPQNNKFIPQYAKEMTATQLAEVWVDEYESGISGTSIRPGFIKIGIDNSHTLQPMHKKLVKAAALTHLKTGLTIASHTGVAEGLWPQLKILKETGVSPQSFIWLHAHMEDNPAEYIKAAEMGCWISLDGLGWEWESHVDKILFAKEKGILDKMLISNDAGWYDPQKTNQTIKPYTNIFTKLYPELKAHGFTDEEFNLLIRANPSKAFSSEITTDLSPSKTR